MANRRPASLCRRLAKGFHFYLRGPSRLAGSRPAYGITVSQVSAGGREFWLTLTFRSGRRYCCESPHCHLGLLFGSDFDRLRACFREAGVEVPRPMRIHLRVVYEGGALFAVSPGDARPEYQPVRAHGQTAESLDEEEAMWREST
jgi:hypothetical protein